MKYDVFISYSSLDQKVAEGVCAYLEQHRIRCFIAYRDIPKGVVWASAIVDALDESRMMVVVFSSNFNCSKHVEREIELASEDNIPILTFRISNEVFKGAKKYYLKNLNWIDAFPHPEQCFGNLCENVQKLLGLKDDMKPARKEQSYIKKYKESVIKEQPRMNDDKKSVEPKMQNMNDEKMLTFKTKQEINLVPIDTEEQFSLACKYEKGEGVPLDKEKAFYWYRKAAEQGHANAQNSLGYCYELGIGIERNEQQAVESYRKAAEQGYAMAQYNLGVCYEYGHGVVSDYKLAVYWYRKAAEQGYAKAQHKLGVCYKNGLGVSKNLQQAVYWYSKAAVQGDQRAQEILEVLVKWLKRRNPFSNI